MLHGIATGTLMTLFALALPVSRPDAQESAPAPAALFLHYRWHKDGRIALVRSEKIPVRLKPSRSAGRRPAALDPAGTAGGQTVLTYALLSSRGDTLSEIPLRDPGILRVEYQEKGDTQLRNHAVAQDSGDIFLRIAEPEAASIRFFKWHPLAPAGALPKAAASKTLIAEFTLP